VKSPAYVAVVAGLSVLAFVGATSYVGWFQNQYELRLRHVGQRSMEQVRHETGVFKVLRKAANELHPAEHFGDGAHVILAYDGQDLPTPTRIETFYLLYPMIPQLMDMHDPAFRAAAMALPKGGFVVSDPDLELPDSEFERRDGSGYFVNVRR
jgi:hypothetical protein